MRFSHNQKPGKKLTLQTLLLSYTAVLILLLLLVSVTISFNRFRDYIADQLQGHAQDAATAVGLSLSNAIDGRDPIASATLIDATFDSGRYLSIQYHNIDGELVVERTAGLDDFAVPDWFLSLVQLPMPVGGAEVVRGWQRLGTVTVVSHPGRAYRDLWRVAWLFFVTSALVGGLALAVLYWVLMRMFRPLRAIEVQAEAIGHRDFSQRLEPAPTRDLDRVTLAMNQMADDLEELFEGQSRLVQHLRKLNSEDPVTGLMSRQAFDQRLKVEVEAEETAGAGVIALLQLANFGQVNRTHGRAQADQLLLRLGAELKSFVLDHNRAFAARRTGAEFAVFMPGAALTDGLYWYRQLMTELDGIYADFAAPVDVAIHCGVARIDLEMSARDGLAVVDQALRQAQASEHSDCQQADQTMTGYPGESWRLLISEAMDQDGLQLMRQPVYGPDGVTPRAGQIFCRLRLEDEWVRGAVFAPMAERFGLMARLDLIVVERTLAQLAEDQDEVLMISLGNTSVADADFQSALLARLKDAARPRLRLQVGIQEHSVHHHWDQVSTLVRRLRELSVGVIIDGFGAGGVPFSYLRQLPLQALRIDQSFVRDVAHQEDNRFYLESVVLIAHSRGIKVYVSGVETATDWAVLQVLGIDGATGYHLGRPVPVEKGPDPA